ncbi:MAG TPA: DUF2797 domain-containing protein [Gammaproteobacteria bacterium]|nr:DUF2797 domain-containing protein [Gammaproteobacteria bacterium]
MKTELAHPVAYTLLLDDQQVRLNPAIGHPIKLTYQGVIHCTHCGRKSRKSFNQGYCYPCFKKLAQCDICIVSPEKCHFDQGSCREPDWGEANCFQPHFVYLANSSGVKVGITRHTQIPTRWIDQGAVAALPVLKVRSRKISGLLEVAFKAYVADKTSWQRMLKGVAEPVDLYMRRDELLARIEPEIASLCESMGDDAVEVLADQPVVDIHYPVETYPTKVKSLNFDKTPEVSGVLQGIKGQYLLLDSGVINIRKFGGYHIELDCDALN